MKESDKLSISEHVSNHINGLFKRVTDIYNVSGDVSPEQKQKIAAARGFLNEVLFDMVENNSKQTFFNTNLNRRIENPKDAKRFLNELYNNDELFHPDDDPADQVFENSEPSQDHIIMLRHLMNQVFIVAGKYKFDPYEYCNFLIKGD